ncbi:MAG TPA: NAD-dependent epimerase/dehydratase family protein, partial [Rhodobacterales bacterium]|nr:NAD-dependent epimerase/dehydratase family protein [Rhodobacterales bacterium]
MKRVLIAGATGYLGRHLVTDFRAHGWYVIALVRSATKARRAGLEADAMIEGEATRPADLAGIMDGVNLVVSALGITRQKDGLSYRDVDFHANANLLTEAERAGVGRFAY